MDLRLEVVKLKVVRFFLLWVRPGVVRVGRIGVTESAFLRLCMASVNTAIDQSRSSSGALRAVLKNLREAEEITEICN